MLFFIQIISITVLLLIVPALLYLLGRNTFPRAFRRIAYELHLWLGIICGLILFVVCLSGTLLTFKTEMIQFLEHDRYFVKISDTATPKSLEELVPLVEKNEQGKVVRVTIPPVNNQAWIFNVKKENPASAKLPAGMPAIHAMLGTAYLVNPYTGESLGPQRSKIYMFFMALTFLHRFLLLDIRTGQMIVGGATLIFLVLVISGLCLWLPPKLRSWKTWLFGLRLRTGKGWKCFWYDCHNTLGFYILIPVVIMALTGPVISFAWYRSAFGQLLGAKPFGKLLEKPVSSKTVPATKQRLKWDDFIDRGNQIASRNGITRLSLPQSPEGSVTFQRIGTGFCNIAATDKIQFDQYTGELLQCDLFDELPFNEKIALLIFPLHTGEIFGTISKMIYFVACLIATSLPITGVVLWIKKLRSHYAKRKQISIDAQNQSRHCQNEIQTEQHTMT